MSFERARAIADAVLMEGYALYPYRASAPKNRFRWTFGVVAPRAWSEAGGCERWWLGTELLARGRDARLAARLRCFQIERRRSWDEGILREIDCSDGTTPFAFDGIAGAIVVERTLLDDDLVRIAIRVENHTPWDAPAARRDHVLTAALASVHVLVAITGGALLSATDPRAAHCKHTGLHPVLVGPPGSDDLVLAAPFILYDHPQIAPESAGDLCDATEIDELLMLRTQLLTDREKQEARATDSRTAAIVDRADALPAAWLARMHGAARDLVAGEMVPTSIEVGTKVRLLAPKRRTDAQDLLYAGRLATVVEVRDDVDGTRFVGVTIDDDPAAELHHWYGRCHYYRLDEVELASSSQEAT